MKNEMTQKSVQKSYNRTKINCSRCSARKAEACYLVGQCDKLDPFI